MTANTMTLTVDPPLRADIPILEYVERVVGLYEASRVGQEHMIERILVDTRGSGRTVMEELQQRLGSVVGPVPLSSQYGHDTSRLFR